MRTPIEHPEALFDFTMDTDRGESVVFVGRDAELALLHRFLHQVRSRPGPTGLHRGDGHTALFEACPGMGKMALIREFGRRAHLNGCPAVNVDLDSLTSHGAMKECSGHELGALRRGHRRAAELAGAALTDAGEALRIGRFVKAAIGAAPEPADRWPNNRSRPPLVLLIDEAQDLGAEHKPAVRSLHLANLGWPVLPVFAGTHGAATALGEAGAYRRAEGRDIRLGRLSGAEARQAFPVLCEQFGIDLHPAEHDMWSRRIAADSHGFPQHLNVGLKAAAQELLNANELGRAADFARAATRAADRRDDYYRARLGSVLPQHGAALVAAVKAVRHGAGRRAHARRVQAAFRAASDKESAARQYSPLPPGEESRLVDRAIENGVFQPAPNGHLELSIPSMGDYIERLFSEREVGPPP